mmetsp:Transcript_5290/g.12006  ORF Transcript_5290/g.12006 Transcript_5290/m.12006 type:complete len:518 (+) Transcript_5290:174-1727(+)|eukprot:CAMPEP_0172301146 /NCGR_PEP_ID=MMETSP1058-20130122/3092_1 /TAXON_ID=83371 /ORGANISM="Detonula confervacea, Strain CCMP 353" /LENGTH=517 /DNA_ID=CAMNT_0013011163 /DNA_START=110 /DNA_END=1663 /DNA_ORIENTATION=+
MAEEIRNKFVSWTQNIVKEIKEIPAKNSLTTQGNIYGVGINLTLVQPATSSASNPYNQVGVDSVEPRGPAAKAGLQLGDVIVEVEGKKFDDGRVYLPDDVACAIRGPEGSQVGVVVERDGKRVKFVLTREPIGVAAFGGFVVSSLSSNTAKRGQEKKGVAIQNKSKNEKQVQKTRQENEQRRVKPQKIKQSKEQVGNASCCDGQEKNQNENMIAESKKAASNNVAGSLESLALSEEEHKEKELNSSIEDNDQFDHDTAPQYCCLLGPLTHNNSIDDASEEKTIDNNEEISSIINSVGDDSQWEMISERSGSAIVISFSGSMSGASFRSASPSMLKNKFVLTESTGEAFIKHVVLPTDTLQGLCLAYKISATRLRMENSFSGNSLQMAPKKLRIPNVNASKGMMIRIQDTTSKEFKLYAFVAEIPTMELVEAKAYLDLSSWDLDEALRSAREDDGWSLKGGFEQSSPSAVVIDGGLLSPIIISAVAKPKELTAQDIYAAPPPFDGDGLELKDIKRGKN